MIVPAMNTNRPNILDKSASFLKPKSEKLNVNANNSKGSKRLVYVSGNYSYYVICCDWMIFC